MFSLFSVQEHGTYVVFGIWGECATARITPNLDGIITGNELRLYKCPSQSNLNIVNKLSTLSKKIFNMVKLTSTFFLLLASFAAPSLSAVIDEVVTEIANIASQVNTVNSQVNAIPAGGKISLLNAAVS